MIEVHPPTLPLTPAQFERALRRGHGRAVEMVRQHGTAGLEEQLLHACVTNPVFDAQCEDPRAAWIVAMLDSALQARAVETITTAESDAADDARFFDRRHRAAVLGLLARRTVPGARERLYGMLSRDPRTSDVVGDEPIVELDGAAGLVAVARRFGEWLAEDPEFWASDYVLHVFDEREAPGAARAVLDAVRAQDPAVERYLASLEPRPRTPLEPGEGAEPPPGESRRSRSNKLSAADVIALIRESTRDRCLWLSGWRPGDPQQRALVFEALLAETDPERVMRLLRVFVRYGPPRFDERLLFWADSPNADLGALATRVLSNVSHPRVRELAIARLTAGSPAPNTIRLLRNTYAAGDHRFIEAALHADGGENEVHGRLMDVLDVFEAHPLPEGAPSLCFVAEHTPCSHCRQVALRQLVALEALPGWMALEARMDASEGIRELVHEASFAT